jgi:hypothetical protein
MTRGGRLLLGVLATWMDRVTNDYFAKNRRSSTAFRSVEKHFQERPVEPQISRLKSTHPNRSFSSKPLPSPCHPDRSSEGAQWRDLQFSPATHLFVRTGGIMGFGPTRGDENRRPSSYHSRSVEKHSHEGTAEPQVPPLRCASVGMTRGKEGASKESSY